jgi:hypothetical protein
MPHHNSGGAERRCLGGSSPAALAERSSDIFTARTEFGTQRLVSSVTIRTSASMAREELARARRRGVRECVARLARHVFTGVRFLDLGGEPAAAPGTVLTPLGVGAPGSDGSFAWQTIIGLRVRTARITAYLDTIGFIHGQDEVSLTAYGFNHPFPTWKEQSLVGLLVAHAHAYTS